MNKIIGVALAMLLATSASAQLFVEHFDCSSGNPGIIIRPGTDSVFVPPYSCTLDPPSAIPDLVTRNAGAGKGPSAP